MPTINIPANTPTLVASPSGTVHYTIVNTTPGATSGCDVHLSATSNTNPANDIDVIAPGGSKRPKLAGALWAWSTKATTIDVTGTSVGDGTVTGNNAGGSTPTFVTAGLIGHYKFDEGAGSTVKDYTGLAGDLTLPGDSTAPTWAAGGLQFDGVDDKVALPSSLNSALTVQAFFVTPTLDEHTANGIGKGQVNPCFLVASAAGGLLSLSLWSGDLGSAGTFSPGTWVQGTGVISGTAEAPQGPTFLTWRLGSSGNDSHMVNDRKVTAYSVNSGSSGRMGSGNWFMGGGSSVGSSCMCGRVCYALFYNRALTDAEALQNYDYVTREMAKRGLRVEGYDLVEGGTANQLIVGGDSIPNGYGVSGASYASATYLTALDDSYTILNVALPGASCRSYRQFLSRDILAKINGGAQKVILYVALGTNGTTTDAALLLASLAKLRKKAGANLKIVVGTVASGFSGGVSRDGRKAAQNAIFRASWRGVADALLDIGTIAGVGADASYTNFAANYLGGGDLLHFSATGHALVAPYAQATFNYVSNDLPTSTTTVAYTLLAKDRQLRWNGASNGTIALTKATGHTGERRSIRNASANTLTLNPNGSETINGGSSLVLAAGASVTIESMFNGSESAPACNWEAI